MAQSNVVMSFRKRLRKRGYRDIRILNYRPGRYLVFALEPLSGMGVQRDMDEQDMYEWR